MKCLELMRFIFRGCGWKEKVTYRVAGKLNPAKKRVEFDLCNRQVIRVYY